MIGDSVGRSMTESSTSELPALLDGMFTSAGYDNAPNRCTSDCGLSGVGAAASVPIGTDLVLVELGYNSPTSDFGARIDAMMRALEARQVERVVWVNLSVRTGRADYVAANQALAAARSRWPDLFVLDWAAYSAGIGGNRNRWFATDGIHLTATGQAEMARFVRDQLAAARRLPGRQLDLHVGPRDRRVGGAQHERLDVFRLRSQGTWSRAATTMSSAAISTATASVDERVHLESRQRLVGGAEHHQLHPDLPIERSHDARLRRDHRRRLRRRRLPQRPVHLGPRHRRLGGPVDAGFRPTYRSSGVYSTGYDVMSVGDLDDDGKLDDSLLWDTDSGLWVAQSWTAFTPTFRRGGRWTVGYDAAINGDWNRDGRRDDFVIIDFDNGSAVVHTWSNFMSAYRGTEQYSSTFDSGVAADLDDDRRHNELLLFDRDAAQWQIYTYRNDFSSALARAGTWPRATTRSSTAPGVEFAWRTSTPADRWNEAVMVAGRVSTPSVAPV